MIFESWRLVDSGFCTGAANMAIDEALLESVAAGHSPPVLRLYRWRPAALSLGYFQRGAGVVNLEACRRFGLDVVRRPTGGRAVLHDREVTYAVVAPVAGPFAGGILSSYRRLSDILKMTLSRLGLTAQAFDGRRAGAADGPSSACFLAPSTHELLFQGCKITGGAQKRLGKAFLQHGSIPVDLDPALLFSVLDGEGKGDPAVGGGLLARRVGWLNRWRQEPITVEAVAGELVQTFAECLQVELLADDLRPAEKARASTLEGAKYGNREWNLQGIPH